jgi:hypothetical protein
MMADETSFEWFKTLDEAHKKMMDQFDLPASVLVNDGPWNTAAAKADIPSCLAKLRRSQRLMEMGAERN